MMRLCTCCLLVALPVLGSTAFAHTLGQSYSVWRLDGQQLSVAFHLPEASLALLAEDLSDGGDLMTAVGDHIAAGLQPVGTCSARHAPRVTYLERAGFLQVALAWQCEEVDGARISALFPLDPAHLHTARFTVPAASGNRVMAEGLLTRDNNVLLFGAPRQSAQAVALTYFAIGVEHILLGADHLAFVCVLLLVSAVRRGTGLGAIVWLLTGFTVGHSLSLLAAVLGWVQPAGTLVEALIGFTIFAVGLEFFTRRDNRLSYAAGVAALVMGAAIWLPGLEARLAAALLLLGAGMMVLSTQALRLGWTSLLTATFGLIHGFGFAGSLLEIGVPDDRLFVALAAFNIGVEVGQVAAVVVAFMLAAWLRRAEAFRHFAPGAAAGLCAACVALGVFWFLQRLA